VFFDYSEQTRDKTVAVIDSTASPFKFNLAVLEAIKGRAVVKGRDEFEILKELSAVAGIDIHPGLKNLDSKPVKHNTVIDKEEIRETVRQILGIEG